MAKGIVWLTQREKLRTNPWEQIGFKVSNK